MMDWMKYRIVYLIISGSMILFGTYGLIVWGLKPGVDFTGGSIVEYKSQTPISTEEATQKLNQEGIHVSAIQVVDQNRYLFRMPPISQDEKDKLTETLSKDFPNNKFEELRYETVGPSIGGELIKKTIYAAAIAAGAILLWVAIQFKSFKYGTSAVLAMFHDTFILTASFAIFGHFWGAEVDFLFVTALLTTLSFSVHDTIVVYDRIRESQKTLHEDIKTLANRAVTETMVRSLNNSFTIVFMLLALLLLGGTTTRWFAMGLLVGTVLGTYSSPFVAVPILVTWEEVAQRLPSLGKK
jgi:preprotein translocase subunit SecF